jgi:hypothetical protein
MAIAPRFHGVLFSSDAKMLFWALAYYIFVVCFFAGLFTRLKSLFTFLNAITEMQYFPQVAEGEYGEGSRFI